MEETLRQSQKMEAIGQLTGGVAHDFNNLLQIIHGSAELIADNADISPEFIDPILTASKKGGELTERLLAFARKKHLTPKSIDISDLLTGMRPILDRTLSDAIKVEFDIPIGTWPAYADPGQLENAILNLALNSRDAMPKGGRLLFSCRNATKSDFKKEHIGDLIGSEFVSISVTDNGAGMKAETLKQAIDPFFTTKGVGEGSGLGLSMVYGFVMQTGGHFEMESKEGVGTTITLFFPRSGEAAEAAGAAHSKKYVSGRGETILVVEDDPNVRMMLKRMLEVLQYRVAEAGSVSEARQVLEDSKHVDLVFTDIGLPDGFSGLDFARQLATSHPNLPVACMSGYPDALSAEDDLIARGTLLIRKPFRRDELASCVRRLLIRHEP